MPRRGRQPQWRGQRFFDEFDLPPPPPPPPAVHHHSHYGHHPPHLGLLPRRGVSRSEGRPRDVPPYAPASSHGANSHRHRGRGHRRRYRWKPPSVYDPDDASLSGSESQDSHGYQDDACQACGENPHNRHVCHHKQVGVGRGSPGVDENNPVEIGQDELHQAQLAAHRAFEALSRQMRNVSMLQSSTSTDRDRGDDLDDSEDESTDSFISDMENNLQSEYRKFVTRISQHMRERRSDIRVERRDMKRQRKDSENRWNEIRQHEDKLAQKEKDFDEMAKKMEAQKAEIVEERSEIERKWQKLEEEVHKMEQVHQLQQSRVKLDIGGHIFTTSTSTLTRESDSMLAAMFSGRHAIKREEDGTVFIDRDGTHFRYILNYLRDGGLSEGSLPEDRQTLKELMNEAVYFQLDGLIKSLQERLNTSI